MSQSLPYFTQPVVSKTLTTDNPAVARRLLALAAEFDERAEAEEQRSRCR